MRLLYRRRWQVSIGTLIETDGILNLYDAVGIDNNTHRWWKGEQGSAYARIGPIDTGDAEEPIACVYAFG